MIEQTTEEVLLTQWQQGEEEAFSQIVKTYLPKVVNLAYRYLKDRQLAEDIAQEIFLKLYRHPDAWKPISRFSTWLYRVTFNACTDQWRKKKKEPETGLEEQEIPVHDSPSSELITSETTQLVRQAIGSLPEDQKRIILLYQEGFSYEEIAEVLECSVKAIERRLYRVRKCLRKKLKDII